VVGVTGVPPLAGAEAVELVEVVVAPGRTTGVSGSGRCVEAVIKRPPIAWFGLFESLA
jgi:hypothetical protein